MRWFGNDSWHVSSCVTYFLLHGRLVALEKCLAYVLLCDTLSTVRKACETRILGPKKKKKEAWLVYFRVMRHIFHCLTGLSNRVASEKCLARVLRCNASFTIYSTGLWRRVAGEKRLWLRLWLWRFRPPRSRSLHLRRRNCTYCPAVFIHWIMFMGLSVGSLSRAGVNCMFCTAIFIHWIVFCFYYSPLICWSRKVCEVHTPWIQELIFRLEKKWLVTPGNTTDFLIS